MGKAPKALGETPRNALLPAVDYPFREHLPGWGSPRRIEVRDNEQSDDQQSDHQQSSGK